MHTIKGEDGERLGSRRRTSCTRRNSYRRSRGGAQEHVFLPAAWGNITSQVGAAENAWKRYGVTPRCNEFLNDPQNWYLGDTRAAPSASR